MENKEFEQLKEEKMKELRGTMAQTVENIDKAFEESDNLEIKQYLGKFKNYIRSKKVQEGYDLNKKYFKDEKERDYYIKNRASLEGYDIMMAEREITNKDDLWKLFDNDPEVSKEHDMITSEISRIEIEIANKYQKRNKEKETIKNKKIKQKQTEQTTKKIFRIGCLSLWLIVQFVIATSEWFTVALITMMITAGGINQSKKQTLVERCVFQGANIMSVLVTFMNGLTHGATWRFCIFICCYSNWNYSNLFKL